MKTLWIISLSVCVGGLLTMMLTRSCQVEPPLPEMMVLRDTITEVYIDTFTAYKPQPYKVMVHDTVYIEKGYASHVFVQETKWFGDNETYDMQVSGINAELDWIKIYPKTVCKTITETKTEIYANSNPLSFWLSAKYKQIGKEKSIPLTIEARYSKKNEEYFIGGGYDLLLGQQIVEFGGRKKF